MNLSEKYEPLFNIPKGVDTFIITGGRFSAKSFAVSTAACHWSAVEGHRILYTRYTGVSGQDSIIPEFEEKIKLLEWSDYFEVNNTRITVKHNKAKIVFKGLKTGSSNQTANLKSIKDFSCWILEEAEELDNFDIYEKISLSVRGNEKGSGKPNLKILILNPETREHWIYKHFFEERQVTEGYNGVKGNICYIHTSYLDCIEFLPDNIIRQMEYMKENNPDRYKHVVMGGWLNKHEGAIFNNWSEGEFDESLPAIYGADFGYVTDPSTLVKVAVDNKSMKLYVHELLNKQGLSTDELEREYNRHCSKQDLIIADNAEPRLINELWDKGFNINPCQKGKDSVKNGIAKMQDYEIIVTPDSHNIKKELNNYAWHDKKSNTPQDQYNHQIDAIRYAFTDLVDDNDFFVA